jgi:hypothetical protein
MKTYGDVKVQVHSFLSLVINRDEWLDSRSGSFDPGKGSLVPNGQEARWARTGLDIVAKGKSPLQPGRNQTSAHKPVEALNGSKKKSCIFCVDAVRLLFVGVKSR